MDSMRHLSTSLPPASSRQRNDQSSDILADFKAAALSVTNLYKTAASAQARARAAGYQDALDDLLAFLDKENLGLMDGEGWRVRQWATERLDSDGITPRQGTGAGSNMTDDDEESTAANQDDKDEERASSPEVQKKPTPLAISSSDLAEEELPNHRRVVSEPPQLQSPLHQQHVPPTADFTFQSMHAYPTNHDRERGMDLDTTSPPYLNLPNEDTVRLVRRSRSSRHNRTNNDARIPSLNINLGSGAGSKRKIPYPDFFDISGFHDGLDRKDGNGPGRGGKRGRHA